jgi:Uma2 family endonuclease
LNNSEPEPDIAILPPGDYSKSHPTSALIVLEVSNSSLSLDRKKANTYAKGNIPEYVLVNLIDEKMEIYKYPKEGIYTEIRILSKEDLFTSQSVKNLSFSLDLFL